MVCFILSGGLGGRPGARRTVRMSAEPVGIGVIGCGRIGQVHAKTLAASMDAQLVVMADPVVDFAEPVAKSFGADFVPDYKDLVNDPRVRGVVIGSPTPYHAEQIIASAEAGKDIFCEKPISNDLEVIDKCLKVVEDKGVRLLTGFQRRFDPNFRKVKQEILNGAIGDVRMFHITSRDPSPPPAEYLKKSGGIFLDMISHDFDMARFVSQSEIDEVFVTGKAFGPEAAEAEDFDSVVTMLRMKNGSFGTIENSRSCAFGYDQRIEVFGSKGTLTGNNRGPSEVVLSNSEGITSGLPFSFFMDRYTEGYRDIMTEFVNMIVNQKEPSVDGYDGRAPILAAMACKLSAAENRPVLLKEVDV
uniref:Inositol 2-dehydrogenase n=1 Tax=Rhodosorus marinus TaxID=101924 RepID=A0A7S2ZAH6_9RHOD|mmetsp:Transcript_12143/g.50372  ORF Transcript_12143/g.50372 Transcript_12143/m.50372 type:complete len:359 (+) Transcript_12143:104-1180(+)